MSKTRGSFNNGLKNPSPLGIAVGISSFALMMMTLPAPAQTAGKESGTGGPVRLARVSYTSGSVSFRTGDQDPWSSAAPNMPLRQGAEITAGNASRVEIQFDDGSRLRLGPGSMITLTQLFSDSQGEFTQLTLRGGEASMRLTKSPSVYQVDGPLASVVASGPARIRIDAEHGERASVYDGSAVVQGASGKATISSGASVSIINANDPYNLEALPPADPFDRWTSSLDAREDAYVHSPSRAYVPSNVAIMTDNFEEYGEWRSDPHYGRVWHPRPAYADWRPYHDGHWVYVTPFGWTWVADEPWGWAPYHYGTWVHEPYGWVWVPGPATQYWSPAVVSFYQSGVNVAWCPLAPAEVVYPATLGIGFRSGNWSFFFGVGAAAVYFPNAYGRCEPRPWDTRVINRVTYVNNTTIINNYGRGGGPGGGLLRSTSFVPYNARTAAGASMAQVASFGGRGRYSALPAGSVSAFHGGGYFGASAGNTLSGPSSVRPTALSMSPTRALQAGPAVPRDVMNRPVNRTLQGGAVAARQSLGSAPGVAAGSFSRSNGRPGVAGSAATGVAGRTSAGLSPGASAAARARNSLGIQHPGSIGGSAGASVRPGSPSGGGSFSRARTGSAAGSTGSFNRSGPGSTSTSSGSFSRPGTGSSSSAASAAAQARNALGSHSGAASGGSFRRPSAGSRTGSTGGGNGSTVSARPGMGRTSSGTASAPSHSNTGRTSSGRSSGSAAPVRRPDAFSRVFGGSRSASSPAATGRSHSNTSQPSQPRGSFSGPAPPAPRQESGRQPAHENRGGGGGDHRDKKR